MNKGGIKMKKIIFSLLLLAAGLCACNPVVDDIQAGGVVDESALQLDVHATTDGGNQIAMVNNTPKVGSYWKFSTGYSSAQNDTVSLPFLGKQTITFTGICDGGTVTTTRTVNITKIDHPVAVQWALFAGTGTEGKTWTWDGTASAVYGTGGYLAKFVPNWTSVTQDKTDQPDGYMVFDLNGGANFTRYNGDGTIAEKGTFSFDMSSTKTDPDDNSQWSIGVLKLTGASVLNGYIYGTTNPLYQYDILTLTDDQMVLCAAPDGTAAWDNGTFWLFHKK
jgi:predicted small secreted protein